MGYIVPARSPRLNVDRHGMPRDYATYVWTLYRRHVEDRSPERQVFLHGRSRTDGPPLDFGQQEIHR